MHGAPHNPRRRPRRGGNPRLKNGFPRVSADPQSNGAGIAARGAPWCTAGGIMFTVPSRFECANFVRGPSTGSGAPAMGQRVPMAGDSFQMGIFFLSTGKILESVLKFVFRSYLLLVLRWAWNSCGFNTKHQGTKRRNNDENRITKRLFHLSGMFWIVLHLEHSISPVK